MSLLDHGAPVVLASLLLSATSVLSAQPAGGTPAAPVAPDRYAAIRHVKLNPSGSLWVGFGGQMRERVESWSNFNFGALPAAPAGIQTSDSFLLTRILASADLHAGNRVRFFAQAKSGLSTRRELAGGRRTSDVDELDAHQLFAEVRLGKDAANAPLTVKAGRLEMAYGRERLVSALDWANTRRSFDGATVAYAASGTTFTAFWTQPVLIRLYKADRRDSSTTLFGLYGTRRLRGPLNADAYWIGQRRDSGTVVWNGTSGRELRHTLGTRLWSPVRPQSAFDLEGEAAFHFGEMGSNSISALMVAAQAGYTVRRGRRSHRFYLSADYASGDDAAGGDVGTFSQMNPQTHAHLGFADIAGRQNLLAIAGGGAIALWRVTVAPDFHVFRRASATDAFYAKSGAVSRPAAFGTSKAIARELDLTVRYPVDRYMLLVSGWSHVFPGAFIEQGGSPTRADKPIDFVYLTVQYSM